MSDTPRFLRWYKQRAFNGQPVSKTELGIGPFNWIIFYHRRPKL